MPTRNISLIRIYQKLFNQFGPQYWWPGDSPFEIIVGAILTQNTNWRNVERAIHNLKKKKSLSPAILHRMPIKKIALMIRPAGFFNLKARRLKNFLDFLFSEYKGKLSLLAKDRLAPLRIKLLSVNGLGPETADSILLYAFNKPIFVVDAYTKRIFSRHLICPKDASYEDVQGLVMKKLKKDRLLFNEFHALIVKVGKEFCRPQPRCQDCPLNKYPHYND